MTVMLRPAEVTDCAAICAIFADARGAGLPYLPVLHSGDEEREPDARMVWRARVRVRRARREARCAGHGCADPGWPSESSGSRQAYSAPAVQAPTAPATPAAPAAAATPLDRAVEAARHRLQRRRVSGRACAAAGRAARRRAPRAR
ncbi:MAG: hypothetical protein ACRDMZ_17820, partial [Solirubrobacteraceae bacterium]